ncbi:nuclear transport factor 2 family protein [Pelagibius marinus]|uniref:nuclear transport factor 2 family protein n=1 Tax=Pelagibius marinus TaxID=2762760 RepID=UPI001872B834|nr:nuclear transport factor 2 family protein [Pelagibius marinus]
MEQANGIAALVRRYFSAYESGDRAVIEELLAEDFRFRSPLDEPPIGKARYLERCWPGHEKIKSVDFQDLFVDGEAVVVRYLSTLYSGAQYRGCEYMRAEGGRIVEVDVYFGNTPDYLFSIFGVAPNGESPQA